MAHSPWSSYPYQKVRSEARLNCRAKPQGVGTGGEATSRRINGEVMAASTDFFRLVRRTIGRTRPRSALVGDPQSSVP
jgi:hypothetical protein